LAVCYAWLGVKERTIKPDLLLTKSPVNKMRIFFFFLFPSDVTLDEEIPPPQALYFYNIDLHLADFLVIFFEFETLRQYFT
jgi:hypothetical protein